MPTIIRSPKRKRTVALHVEADGSVTVHAPVKISMAWINAFIAERAGWIERRRKEIATRHNAPTLSLQEGSLVPFMGRELRLVFNKEVSANETTDCLPMTIAQGLSPADLQAEIRTELILWYKKQARRIMLERVDYWARQIGVTPARVIITAPKKRWGSCSAKDEIRLNWRLIMADADLLDYVIVHELCHIPHKNHGKRFWAKVSQFTSDVRAKRQALRLFDKSPFSSLIG